MSEIFYCLWFFWLLGSVIAGIVACVEVYYLEKRGENIDEFCNVMCTIIIISWIYLILSRKRLKDCSQKNYKINMESSY